MRGSHHGGRLGIFVAKGDLPIFQFENALIADGNPKNIAGQILQSHVPITNGFGMNYPVLPSDCSGDLIEEFRFLQSAAILGVEVLMGQDLDDDQSLEAFLESQRCEIQAGLFVVSDIRNPSLIWEY